MRCVIDQSVLLSQSTDRDNRLTAFATELLTHQIIPLYIRFIPLNQIGARLFNILLYAFLFYLKHIKFPYCLKSASQINPGVPLVQEPPNTPSWQMAV